MWVHASSTHYTDTDWGLEGDANSAPRQAASNPTRGRRRLARLSLRRTHPRGGGIGRHFPLTVDGASLAHETTAVATLLTPYRTAVEYGGGVVAGLGRSLSRDKARGPGPTGGTGRQATGRWKGCDELVWVAMNEKDDRAVAVGGVAGGGELMQPRAKQVVMNGQAGVLSLMAPLLYFWSPGWMLGGGAPPTASPAPSGGRAARRVHQNSPMMVRPAEVDSTMLTGVLASTS